MSSARLGVAALVRLGSVVALSAMLAGCFRPMYAQKYSGGTVTEEFSRIHVSEVDTRFAQQVRNELIFDFTGDGRQTGSDYRLNLGVTRSVTSMIVNPSRDADVRVIVMRARFSLTEQATGVVLFSGETESRASYEFNRQLFSNERAKIDAENRAARTVAEDIRLRLGAFFASRDSVGYQVSQPKVSRKADE